MALPEAPAAVPPVHRTVPQYLARRFWQICSTLQSEAYSDHNLLPWQFALLVQVLDTPGMERGWLAAAIGGDATSVGQTLDRLAREGLVERAVNPRDRRAAAYTLTPAGVAFVQQLRVRSRAIARQILAPLSEAEADTLLRLLARLVDAHEAHARPGAGRRAPRRTRQTE